MNLHPPPLAEILPASIRSRLLNLSIKAELAAQESPVGRAGKAYQAIIREIDQVREQARARRPDLFRFGNAMETA